MLKEISKEQLVDCIDNSIFALLQETIGLRNEVQTLVQSDDCQEKEKRRRCLNSIVNELDDAAAKLCEQIGADIFGWASENM